MSPLALRRFRAERLLRRDFDGLRATVLSRVRSRLVHAGARLDSADLEACYAQAWQGLYATMVAGQEVLSPVGWLTQVTFRRAIEEVRAAHGSVCDDVAPAMLPARERDPADRLDDRARLRQVFEALRMRLRGRECEAASLCYLQGLSRSEAAVRMGISEARMRKLMDGAGAGRPGVAAKVGDLLLTIRAGRWCEEQASSMRGLAFGLLEPGGERHRLALAHQRECPACRAYVVSLRGLAAALPPLALPVGIGSAGAAAGAGGAVAGSGWLVAGGPVTAKLAVGCALALSVGAGCVALGIAPHRAGAARARAHRRHAAHARTTLVSSRSAAGVVLAPVRGASTARAAVAGAVRPRTAVKSASTGAGRSASASAEPRATREFGPEAPASAASTAVVPSGRATAVAASTARSPPPASTPSAGRRNRGEFGFE